MPSFQTFQQTSQRETPYLVCVCVLTPMGRLYLGLVNALVKFEMMTFTPKYFGEEGGEVGVGARRAVRAITKKIKKLFSSGATR